MTQWYFILKCNSLKVCFFLRSLVNKEVHYKLGWALVKLQLYIDIVCMYTIYLYIYIKYTTFSFEVKPVQSGIVCVK